VTTPTVIETTPTIRPVANAWFLAQCRTMRNHVIVRTGDRVVFCGTSRTAAADAAARLSDADLTVEYVR
jgi:hypothetical protein